MPPDAAAIFDALKPVFAKVAHRLTVKTPTPTVYALVTNSPSPFPQHKEHPMDFGSVRVGQAYVSLHLMPIYMCPALTSQISPALKQRMQGKSCFNFKKIPEPALIAELQQLTEAGFKLWSEKNWI